MGSGLATTTQPINQTSLKNQIETAMRKYFGFPKFAATPV
jgi:hypothetical protein